jgi:hypothetical protein
MRMADADDRAREEAESSSARINGMLSAAQLRTK